MPICAFHKLCIGISFLYFQATQCHPRETLRNDERKVQILLCKSESSSNDSDGCEENSP